MKRTKQQNLSIYEPKNRIDFDSVRDARNISRETARALRNERRHPHDDVEFHRLDLFA
jgi:hypothetical protein